MCIRSAGFRVKGNGNYRGFGFSKEFKRRLNITFDFGVLCENITGIKTEAEMEDVVTAESEMAPALEESNVIVMTGTAIVNHSIDSILSYLNEGIRSAIIGPTASMLPDAFFKRGVDVMAGVRILNPDSMISILKQGGSAYHLLKECSEKIAFVKNEGNG